MTWTAVRAAFERLCDLPEKDRETELAKLDPAIAAEVRALFASDSDAASFLERSSPPPHTRGTPPPTRGERLGRFELVRPLGSGGMGTVWEARQLQPERRVALKILASSGWSRAERWRFEYEAQVLATLNHPAIAQLYEAGSERRGDDEVAWFAMELVEDARDFVSYCAERTKDRASGLALFAELCDAVQYGHRRGVIHRDLKPANVLVGRDGRLKLIDFGVARAVDGSSATPSLRTHTGELVGTLQYMAPEQIAGRNEQIDARADVYALGVILYHQLCGEGPYDFRGASLAKVADLVLNAEPKRPSSLAADLAGDLEWILLKALEKDPARRYQSVAELAEDLRRFRAHEPVGAHAPSFAYRLKKYVRRNRATVAIGAAVVLGLGLAFGGLASGMQKARAGELSAREAAEESRRQTERAQREAARSQAVLALVESLFDEVDDTVEGRDVRVADLLDAAALKPGAIADPSVEFGLRVVRGTMYIRLDLYEAARVELDRAIELYPATEQSALDRLRFVKCSALRGRALTRLGKPDEGIAEIRGAIETARAEGLDVAEFTAVEQLCSYFLESGRAAELLEHSRALGALATKLGKPSHERHSKGLEALALQGLGRSAEAVPITKELWEFAANESGAESTAAADALFDYATAAHEAGELELADELYERALPLVRASRGETHNQTLTLLNNRALLSHARGKPEQALERLAEVVRVYDTLPGLPTAEHLIAIANHGMMLNTSGRYAEAEPVLRRAAELSVQLLATNDVNGMTFRFNHAACLAWMKRWSEAEPILLREHASLSAVLPAGHPNLKKSIRTLADAYATNGFPDEAAAWRAKLQ
ncbi:MAG: protein kinase [Planctomycetes bacterium]|nr:protein kinase [Planctomycetota bacterium]